MSLWPDNGNICRDNSAQTVQIISYSHRLFLYREDFPPISGCRGVSQKSCGMPWLALAFFRLFDRRVAADGGYHLSGG